MFELQRFSDLRREREAMTSHEASCRYQTMVLIGTFVSTGPSGILSSHAKAAEKMNASSNDI